MKTYEQTIDEFIDFSFKSSDIGDTTVREYLKSLLSTLWMEGEGFSGKRVFGNSGWEYDLLEAAEQYDKRYKDRSKANKFITDVIEYL